jgi:ATP-binding cassette subfamily B protein
MFDHLGLEGYDREYTDRALARRMVRYFRPYRRDALASTLATASVALLNASVPVVISRGVELLAARDAVGLYAMGILVLAGGVLIWGVNYLRRSRLSRVVGGVVTDMRRDAFHAAVSHDLSFYDRFASGKVVSRITSDTSDFAQSIVLVSELASQVVVLVALVAVLGSISGTLTLMLLAWAPLVVLFAMGFRRLARHVTRQGFRAMAEVNARIFESVAGIAVAKNFRRESFVYDEFVAVNTTSYRINVRRGFVLALIFPVLNVLVGFGAAMLVYYGGLAALRGALAVGAWFLFIQSLDRFWFPLINLAAFSSQVQAGFAAVERVFALIDHESQVVQTGRTDPDPVRGRIDFEGVVLRYQEGATVLPGLDLSIAAGESVALVGHTGAGKSSVVRLVARFYEFQEGRLLVDGRDIRSLDLAAYRRHLGIVPQTAFLFEGSVADNIRYGAPGASDADIMAMAGRVGDGEWLEALPEGLATPVGERGSRLSMGQRQLVALMRVLIQRPAIFVLDEATASIDPFTESQIQDAVELILAGSTSIVIAHRLSTVRACDRIVVLDHGQVIEEGSHAALLASGGRYAQLYDTYFRHQSPDYRAGGIDAREAAAP